MHGIKDSKFWAVCGPLQGAFLLEGTVNELTT